MQWIDVMNTSSKMTDQLLSGSPAELISFFKTDMFGMDYPILFELLSKSESPLLRTLIRRAIKCREQKIPFDGTLEQAERHCRQVLDNSRRKFVRRSYALQPLFALSLIQVRYPDYTADQLLIDLARKAPKKRRREKFVKRVSEFGFRISMIRYLHGQFRFDDLDPALYHRYCNKIAGYQNGLSLKLPIILPVCYIGECFEYQFPWNETKFRIDSFVALSKKAMSFQQLDALWAQQNSFGH